MDTNNPNISVVVPLYNEEESLPEVEATGSLLAIDAPGRDNAADTPAERSAAKVAVPDKLFEWTPSPDPGRVTGGADLIDALLSADQSLLILIEKVGGTCEVLANDAE